MCVCVCVELLPTVHVCCRSLVLPVTGTSNSTDCDNSGAPPSFACLHCLLMMIKEEDENEERVPWKWREKLVWDESTPDSQ